MEDIDDDYEGDLKPLLDELAALRAALGSSYRAYAELDVDEIEGPSPYPPTAPAAQEPAQSPAPAPPARRQSEPIPAADRLAAVTSALEANRSLQSRLKRLITSVMRAQDQAVNIRDRVRDTQRKRLVAAAAPRTLAIRRQQDEFTGISWYWAVPNAPPPAPYPGYADLKAVMDVLPLVYPKRQWYEDDRRALCDGVLQVIQEKRLNEILGELENDVGTGAGVSLEEFEARQVPIRALTIESPEVLAAVEALSEDDWATIAHRCAPGRSGFECRLQWVNAARPGINHDAFTVEEDEELLRLVEVHGIHSWPTIASELNDGTQRTALTCMSRYQQILHAQRTTKEFTAADLARLMEIVKRVGVAWKRVAGEFGGPWDGNQLMHYWRRHVQGHEAGVEPRKGKWDAAEDEALLASVALYGKKWSLVATMVPGRTDVQCRERYVNSLDPSVKNTKWNAEEERILEEAVLEHQRNGGGAVKWAVVAKLLPGRTDNMCWKKWAALVQAKEKRERKIAAAANAAANAPAVTEGTADGTAVMEVGGPSGSGNVRAAKPEPEKVEEVATTRRGRAVRKPSLLGDFGR